jgi:hypothetical protein
VPTSTLCQQAISRKTKDVANLIQARRNQKPKLNQDQINQYFVARDVPNEIPQTSLLSRLIEEGQSKGTMVDRFSEFARFEAFVRYSI